jgi:hypothetical protein
VRFLATWLVLVVSTSSSVRAQEPDLDVEHEWYGSVVCGPEGATSEHYLASGALIKIRERRQVSASSASAHFDELATTMGVVLEIGLLFDEESEIVGKMAEVLSATHAVRIECRGVWVTTIEAGSLEDLRTFVERRNRRASRGQTTPN